jgi:putative salt-induced outer membrane protein YdiY
LFACSGVSRAADPDASARLEAARAALAAAQAELAAAEAAFAEVQASASAGAAGAAPAETAPAPKPSFWTGWESSASVGLAGSSGNSEAFNFRISIDAARKAETMDTILGLIYRYETADGEESSNRFEANARNDWKFGDDSRWRFFVQGRYEMDEFQDWDHRAGAWLGFGYDFLRSERTTLTGRTGVGGTKTWGGDNDDFEPEGFLALDWLHKIDQRQTIKAGTELRPSFDDLSHYRTNSYAEYQAAVNDANSMFLTLGARHRYDSDPGGDAKKSDFDYYATVGWKF